MACVHWVLFKRLKHLAPNNQACFLHCRMYSLLALLLLTDLFFMGFFHRLMVGKRNLHLFAVGLLESASFALKLLAKGLRYGLSTCRRDKEA